MVELEGIEEKARSRLILPFDGVNDPESVNRMATELKGYMGIGKVGKELFHGFGPEAIDWVKRHGMEVFLDTKLHDIPRTVEGAARAIARQGVYMFNVHALGGIEMMEAALEGAEKGAAEAGYNRPKVIGVTMLTSHDEDQMHRELGIDPNTSMKSQVFRLAMNAHDAGLDGIVCSALDLPNLTLNFPEEFLYVTPGIKGANTPAGNDQKRVATPAYAMGQGSSMLVVGSAITKPNGKDNPSTVEERQQAAYDVLQDMARFL